MTTRWRRVSRVVKAYESPPMMFLMELIVGLAYMGLFGFAICMWGDAIGVPSARWDERRRRRGAHHRHTAASKTTWFVNWYVFGFLSAGLVPMGMSIYYYQQIRPELRPETVVHTPHTFASTLAHGVPGQQGPYEQRLPAKSVTSDPTTRDCPWCAEQIKRAAIICKRCRHDIESGLVS